MEPAAPAVATADGPAFNTRSGVQPVLPAWTPSGCYTHNPQLAANMSITLAKNLGQLSDFDLKRAARGAGRA